ncbi:MAG: ABC transporter ATP-binding protein [Pseudomonadota bacterium]
MLPNSTGGARDQSGQLLDRPQTLSVRDLVVEFPTRRGSLKAVDTIAFDVGEGEVLGVVGESGAGKSTIGNAIIGLLEPPGRVTAGEIIFQGENLRDYSPEQMRRVRGSKIGMIFQDPQTSLNPLVTIGNQLTETIMSTTNVPPAEAHDRAVALLEAVGLDEPRLRLNLYPHEFSGGMRQRVVIALALAGDPALVIADEPTTALDVSVQAQILDLIKSICRSRGVAVIFVTHDIGVIATVADRVTVMYQGQIVETGPVEQILGAPKQPYTKSLIAAVPPSDRKLKRFSSVDFIEGGSKFRSIDPRTHWLGQSLQFSSSESRILEQSSDTMTTAISTRNLNISFVLKKSIFKSQRILNHAVKNVSFDIHRGESFGIVGESGSGKSTVARIIAGLYRPSSGTVEIFGRNSTAKPQSRAAISARRAVQMIFQDPYSSLNPRMRVESIISEPIRYHRTTENSSETAAIVRDLLDHVGLGSSAAQRFPHEFSGGQRQRIAIARALASRPRILICDEPTSALDVSVQAQILNLLKDLQDELGLTMIFISHDLPVIRQMCERIAVMKAGEICEIADTQDLFEDPKHAYSKMLISMMPALDMLSPQGVSVS